MQPTIGRIVHYEHEGQTLAAIITNVVGDNIVNLQIFKDGLGGCYFHEGVEMGEGEGQWRWPEIKSVSPVGTVVQGATSAPSNPVRPVVPVPQGTGTGNVEGVPLVSTSPFPTVTSKP